MTGLLGACARLDIPALCDPTSVPKLRRLAPALLAHPRTAIVTANGAELDALYDALSGEDGWAYINNLGLGAEWRGAVDAFVNRLPGPAAQWVRNEGTVTKMVAGLPWVREWWVKGGANGVLHLAIKTDRPQQSQTVRVFQPVASGGFLVLSHYPAPKIAPEEIVSTTGAGDTLAGGLLAGLLDSQAEDAWVPNALQRVERTLRSTKAVG